MADVLFSGVQPSGVLHLGNYIGALRNWALLQGSYESLFCVVDLHSITAGIPEQGELSDNTLSVVASYLACGIDPGLSTIFVQSSVPAHSELSWILSNFVNLGDLNRMTQFKIKGADNLSSSLGLYSYPVLMAADILLYKTKIVPVGADQRQHLELARDLAKSFNSRYGLEYFVVPEAFIVESSARIMSLRDGATKMSKSDASDFSRINLNDSNDSIAHKIRRAKTDSVENFDFASLHGRSEVMNLVGIYAALSSRSLESVCNDSSICGSGMEHFKKMLADLIIENISGIRQKLSDLLQDKAYLLSLLRTNGEKLRESTAKTIGEVKSIIGFLG